MERSSYAKFLAGIYLLMFIAMYFDPYWNATGSFLGLLFLVLTWKREKETNWPLSNCFLNCITGGLYGLFNFDRKRS